MEAGEINEDEFDTAFWRKLSSDPDFGFDELPGCTRVKFEDTRTLVPEKSGIYGVYTNSGKQLKVGISGNLRKRLLQHRASRGLRLKTGGDWENPTDVESKSSILAKHLHFNNEFANIGFNLKMGSGRLEFLCKECFVLFQVTSDRGIARKLEIHFEEHGGFRFKGRPNASGAE